MQEISIGGSLTDQAYTTLRAAIVAGELAADELYSVHQLAGLLRVSKTPVREALIKLATANMVRFERNRGVRVLRTTSHDIEEIFQLRVLLEVPAAADAATRMPAPEVERLQSAHADLVAWPANGDKTEFMRRDRRFHEVIVAATGNDRLAVFVAQLRDMVLTRGLCTAGASRSFADIAAEHEAILTAIRARRPDRAAAAMQDHLTHTAHLLLEQEFGTDHPVGAAGRSADADRVSRLVPAVAF